MAGSDLGSHNQAMTNPRMNATTVEIDSGHLSLITHPQEVTQLILSATRAASQHAAADSS
jgi:hypothetical protein